jgi:hypothetical protein
MITVNEQQIIISCVEHFRVQMAVNRKVQDTLFGEDLIYPTLEEIQAITDQEVQESIAECLKEEPKFLNFLKMVEESTLNKVINYETGV